MQYLFIDFEFTMPGSGVRGKRFFPEIIEAGLVLADEGKILQTFRSFVKPEVHPILTERCKQFLEIRQEDVDRGIPFSQLIDVLRTFYLPESAAIVTWGNMDMLILRRSCERWGLSFPFQGKELDLSIEYMKFYGERKQTGLMKSLQQYGDIPKRQHHRALDDAFATYEIFRRIEKDKEYLMAPPKNCIGDFVDLAQLKKRLA